MSCIFNDVHITVRTHARKRGEAFCLRIQFNLPISHTHICGCVYICLISNWLQLTFLLPMCSQEHRMVQVKCWQKKKCIVLIFLQRFQCEFLHIQTEKLHQRAANLKERGTGSSRSLSSSFNDHRETCNRNFYVLMTCFVRFHRTQRGRTPTHST